MKPCETEVLHRAAEGSEGHCDLPGRGGDTSHPGVILAVGTSLSLQCCSLAWSPLQHLVWNRKELLEHTSREGLSSCCPGPLLRFLGALGWDGATLGSEPAAKWARLGVLTAVGVKRAGCQLQRAEQHQWCGKGAACPARTAAGGWSCPSSAWKCLQTPCLLLSVQEISFPSSPLSSRHCFLQLRSFLPAPSGGPSLGTVLSSIETTNETSRQHLVHEGPSLHLCLRPALPLMISAFLQAPLLPYQAPVSSSLLFQSPIPSPASIEASKLRQRNKAQSKTRGRIFHD